MNPRNRLIQSLKGAWVDCVPLILDGCSFATRAEIAKLGDPRRREIAERAFELTAADVSVPSNINRYLVTPEDSIRLTDRRQQNGTTEWTHEIATPKGPLTAVTASAADTNTTWTIKYPVESLDDIDKIASVPWDLPTDLKGVDESDLPDGFETKCLLGTGVSSPFVCVAGMMPFQYFLELCATDLDLIKELTQTCLDRIMAILDLLLVGSKLDFVWMGGCEWLTPPMGSPQLYDELVQKFEAPLIDRMHDSGALNHLHCHGNVRSTLELAIERDADYFEPVEPPPDGDVTFAEAKKIAAGRITLGGNIEGRIVENESVEAVEAAARAAFEGGKDRMVLKLSAEVIQRKMSEQALKNLHKVIDVWEELS